MTYRLHLADRAERDRDESFAWYAQSYSEDFAIKWYFGLSEAIRSLAEQPLRCSLARENNRFAFELRELLFGHSKRNRHRILFTVEDDTVYVLHIRHSARDEVRPGDVLGT
ncbi:type II toxin-antitoxin system RelE/ParE family toxin [Pirellulales bacterium]|nr:type II toxin-antitoxin system RelE/ParE family toxin [Pirellulales bacterium]